VSSAPGIGVNWEWGTRFTPAQLHKLARTQEVLPQWLVARDLPNVPVSGQRLGGGEGLAIAQSRCRWWIEGMLMLVHAIENAPEPRQRTRTPQTLAHAAVADAIEAGTLVRCPCEVCGSRERVQAHHHDYSKPLDVHWLCQKHHKAHHAALGTYSHNGKVRHSPRRLMTAAGRSAA